MKAWIVDCMHRVFPKDMPRQRAKLEVELWAARNEWECFQVGLHAAPNQLRELRADASDLKAGRRTIPAECVETLWPDYVPVHWNSANNDPADLDGEAPGFFPDPIHRTLPETHPRGVAPSTRSAWVRIRVPEDAGPGTYRGKLKISSNAGQAEVSITLHVWPFALPRATRLFMTNWFRVTQWCETAHVEPMTRDFWKLLDVYARNMGEHRQNTVLTPLLQFAETDRLVNGRPAGQLIHVVRDTKGRLSFDFHNFDRWVRIFFRHGFTLIEGAHIASGVQGLAPFLYQREGERRLRRQESLPRTSPQFRRFLKSFLDALTSHLRRRGWLERFVLHISDEPHGDHYEGYKAISDLIRAQAPQMRIIDAMGDPAYAGFAHHPVAIENRYEDFVRASGLPNSDVWFYYCCGPTGPWPNRFIDFPLIRVRIFTWLAFKLAAPGFLHWGYSHWDWHRPVRDQPYNAYDNTTGGVLQAGDSYVVYPPWNPSESIEPVDSIRWEIIREAMEDYEYLATLRDLVHDGGRGGKDWTARAKRLLNEVNRRAVPSFTEHTRDAGYLLRVRRRIGEMIAEAH